MIGLPAGVVEELSGGHENARPTSGRNVDLLRRAKPCFLQTDSSLRSE